MAWTTLTADGLKNALNNAEIAKWSEFVDDNKALDPVPELIAYVHNEIRGYLVKRYVLPASGIPASLVSVGYDILTYRLCKRVEANTELQRKDAFDDAIRRLERIEEGKGAVEGADDPTAEAETGGAEVVTSSERLWTRDQTDGL